MNEIRLSAVILTHNEESKISQCIHSLSFCDEIVIIDDNSIDRTSEIAKKLGARFFSRPLGGDFSAQRNFGESKARGEWVFVVDPDEMVSRELIVEIEHLLQNPTANAYSIKRVDSLFGNELKFGDSGFSQSVRLAKKGIGKWRRRVHETWEVFGQVIPLKSTLAHVPHDSLSSFVQSINDYSTLHALANQDEGKKTSIFKIVVIPGLKFLYNYIIKLGFLDGVSGFIHAIMMSLHSFLSWSKMYLKK